MWQLFWVSNLIFYSTCTCIEKGRTSLPMGRRKANILGCPSCLHNLKYFTKGQFWKIVGSFQRNSRFSCAYNGEGTKKCALKIWRFQGVSLAPLQGTWFVARQTALECHFILGQRILTLIDTQTTKVSKCLMALATTSTKKNSGLLQSKSLQHGKLQLRTIWCFFFRPDSI